MADEQEEIEVFVDRDQPPKLTFDDTGGAPFLSHDAEKGWLLNKQHYYPVALHASGLDSVSDALVQARELLKKPLHESGLVWSERVSLLSDWGKPGGDSSFLDANLEPDGALTVYGQNLGPTVGRDGEYEYWYRIDAEHIPALLVALGGDPEQGILDLLQQRWSGDAADSLEIAIRNSGVEYRFTNYF